ncbi:MAG: hypothetical protein E7318_03350 [Clostridiales bacterium]|nr:hypothetical protein [Clostridiales bacterium]
MNKRKIMLVASALLMVAILGFGGTLAYLTDTDAQINTFTTGNVAIDLYEDFDNDEDGVEKLLPVTYFEDGERNPKNVVEKEVYVKNTGSELAWVRVHIAIPHVLDNGNPDFDAGLNVLHFNYAPESIGAGKWDWSKAFNDGKYEGDWNYYETTIGGKAYNVYVVTYTTALTKNAETVDAMSQVYLDSKVTNEDITRIKAELGDEWKIYVAAEGCQADGFDDPYYALNTSFGNPTDADYTSAIDWTTISGETIVEK